MSNKQMVLFICACILFTVEKKPSDWLRKPLWWVDYIVNTYYNLYLAWDRIEWYETHPYDRKPADQIDLVE